MLREKELKLLEDLKNDNARKTEEIQQLRNNQLIGQAEGEETATITDGALAFANILEETEIEVEGKKKKAYLVGLPQGISRQEQREGYNLFDAINSYPETHTKTGITFTKNSDGTFNAHGTATSDTSIGLATGIMGYLVAGEEYSLYSNIPYNNTTFNLSLTYGGEGMTNKYILANSSKILDDITQWATLNLYIPNGQTINVDNVKVMICKGAYDSSKPFEQYGETPSIEIPSEIENVKAWNLIDVEQIAKQTQNVITTFDKKNGWLTIENSNSNMAYVNILVPVEHIIIGKTYSLKVEFKSKKGCNVYLQKSPEDYSKFTQGIDAIIKNTATDTYMKVLVTPIANQTVTVRLSLAEEQEKIEDKPYAPYGAINIHLNNKNLISGNIEDWEYGHYSSITGEKEPYAYRIRLKELILAEPNTTYYVNNFSNNVFNLIFRQYDKDKKLIPSSAAGIQDNFTFDTSSNTKYISISMYNRIDMGEVLTFENYKTLFENGTIKPFICLNSEINKEYITHQEQNYNLHLGNLELNGIGDTRDSLVIELKDENMSCKKIKKLYLKKRFEKYIFNGTEIINFGITREKFTKMNISFLNSKTYRVQDNYESSVGLLLSNYFKVLTNANAQWLNDSVEDITLNESGNITFSVSNDFAKTAEEFKAKLLEFYNNSRPLEIIYRLNKPELIDITDNIELVKDVEYLINNFKTFKEVTHVEVDNGYIDLEYVKSTGLALKNIQQQIDNIQAVMLEGGTGNA